MSLETDPGIYINPTLKPGAHHKKATNKATVEMLTQITKCFHYSEKNSFLKLTNNMYSPHFEFAALACSAWQGGNIVVIEKVQEKALSMMSGLKGNSYTEMSTIDRLVWRPSEKECEWKTSP
jgi:hypothetical protein